MKRRFKKILLTIVTGTAMLFGFSSCDNPEEIIAEVLNLDQVLEVNITVDTASLQVSTFMVQTLAEKDTLNNTSTCTIKAFDNNKAQIIAVTDMNENLLMMYRGPVTNGQNITINAQSTAQAMVTFAPLFGPVGVNDYNSMLNIITSTSTYPDFQSAVVRAIARGNDLTDTTNAEMMATLYNLFREVAENAYATYYGQTKATKDANGYIACDPMVATTDGNTLTLRTAGNCPSYYGEVYDAYGNKIEDVNAPTAATYGIMDVLSPNHGQTFGKPYTITFTNEGNYTFMMSRTNTAALTDFYAHLVSNILCLLGADINNNLIGALSRAVAQRLEQEGFEFGHVSNEELMGLISDAYDETVQFLDDEYEQVGQVSNWQLAARMLKRLTTIYASVHEATDAIMRVAWNLSDIREEVDFCVNYTQAQGIQSCLDVNVMVAGGNNQIGSAYTLLPQPLSVHVATRDSNGNYSTVPQRVLFTVEQGDGTLSQSVVMTNGQGIAQTSWTLGGGNSGSEQRVRAVVVNENNEPISNDVFFGALISNDRWRINLRCAWADTGNYTCSYDVDFAMAEMSDSSDVVQLVSQTGTGWDYYDGPYERYALSGTYNKVTHQAIIEIAMYTVEDNLHFRTDRFNLTLTGNRITSYGQLIYDNGAGCEVAIDMYRIGADATPAKVSRKHAKAPAAIPAEKRSLRRAK